MRKINYRIPLLLAAMVALGMFAGAKFHDASGTRSTGDVFTKFNEVLRYIDIAYVDKADREELVESAIESMLSQLDPHSTYIPARDLKAANEELEGNFEGIGIEFNLFKDTIMVVSPISGGPSEELGIRAGDRIVKINGKTVAGVGFKNDDVVKNLRGPKGSKVDVSIKRGDENGLIDYTITRDKIPIYSVDASYMAAPGVGYIKINRFGGTTLNEYSSAISNLKRLGMQSLILDLRGNPGGYLKAAIDLADEFLAKDKLIVYTQGRSRPKESYSSTGQGYFEKGRLAILIDEGSASASEIVSGAVQDWDRGVIIGRRSFGKGLVQEPFMLSDGSALRLTVARYYTPSGRNIQKPYTEGYEAYMDELDSRFKHGEFVTKDSITMPDSLKFYTAAKRIVYGGGGILPDIFVPLDTTANTLYVRGLFGKNLFNEYINSYVDRNRTSLMKKYPDFNAFDKGFDIGSTVKDFTEFAEGKGVKPENEMDAQHSARLVRNQLKALVARQLYKNEAFYRVVNSDNETFIKALEVLGGDQYDKVGLKTK